ncbi:MAG: hypothetical protein OEV66_10415 [Spirochaetia bacterium]|nr:hypothetical protein [Spirochaetia bacterium]
MQTNKKNKEKQNSRLFDFRRMNRLDFIKLSGLALIAGTLPGCKEGSTESGGANVSSPEVNVVRAYAETLLPKKTSQETISKIKIAQGLDDVFGYQNPDFVSNIRLAIKVLEYGPMYWALKFSRFSQLSLNQRKQFLRDLAESDSVTKRSVIVGVKTITLMAMFERGKENAMGEIMNIHNMELCR